MLTQEEQSNSYKTKLRIYDNGIMLDEILCTVVNHPDGKISIYPNGSTAIFPGMNFEVDIKNND